MSALTLDVNGAKHPVDAAAHLALTPDFAEGLRAFLEKRPPKWE